MFLNIFKQCWIAGNGALGGGQLIVCILEAHLVDPHTPIKNLKDNWHKDMGYGILVFLIFKLN